MQQDDGGLFFLLGGETGGAKSTGTGQPWNEPSRCTPVVVCIMGIKKISCKALRRRSVEAAAGLRVQKVEQSMDNQRQ